MRRKTFLRNYAEFALVRALIMVIQAMPFRTALGFAKGVGTLLYLLDGRHRRVALDNLRQAFGERLSRERRRRLARASLQHLVLVGTEMAQMVRLVKESNWRKYFVVKGDENAREAASLGRGVIFLSGHLGNWEILSWAMGLLGYPLHAVVRPMDNPLLDDLLNRFRRSATQVPVAKEGAMRKVVAALRESKYLAILIDQDAKEDGVFVDFLGRPASTVKAPAALSLKLGAPIVTGYGRRIGKEPRFEVFIDRPIFPESTGDREEDIKRITQKLTSQVESYIRKFPHRWLWMHRRWKTRPKLTQTETAC